MNASRMVIVREACRLLLSTNMSINEIARVLSISAKRVSRIHKMLRRLKLTHGQVEGMGDSALKLVLYPKRRNHHLKRVPNWSAIYELMRNRHQTLIQLWEEYRLINPADAYSYSQFTYHYSVFLKSVDISMRMVHHPGECVFVDFAGLTVPYFEQGNEKQAQIFVAVSGASNYSFAYACRDQTTESWIDAHNCMFVFFDGVHHVIVPDNLKAAVIRAGKFPLLNRTYLEMACHYDTVIAPARVRKPKDKAKAEAGVLFVTRWITAPLRRRKFFSLEEINEAIREMLPALNERKFRRLPGTRHSRFLEVDKPALKPLPSNPFELISWIAEQKVAPDYHVFVEGHFYSVPYQYVGKMVEACYSTSTAQIFHDHKRIATHKRSYEPGGRTLDKAHMTSTHRAYSERQLGDFIKWAKGIGVHTLDVVKAQFEGKLNDSYTAAICCDKLKRLCSMHGAERFEAACRRAVFLDSLTYKTISSILSRRIESLELPEQLNQESFPVHQNVRGSSYYDTRGNI